MAPFRPTYLNKRYYPGNASVIGPTKQATLGISTTTCCSSTNVCGACSEQNILGCRCTFCACPCCNVCCSCQCTVCTQTVPGGKWSKWEQYEASTRSSWGSGSVCSTGAATCLCCTNLGTTCVGATPINDCKGFFFCCGPGTIKYFVAPSCTQVFRAWTSKDDAVTQANSLMGSCGWFVPDLSQLYSGYSCSGYWDSVSLGPPSEYWSSSQNYGPSTAQALRFSQGISVNRFTSSTYYVRAFRCTAS